MPKITTPLLTEDFYGTTLTGNIAATGDIILNVTTPPANKKGFIIVDPESVANREKMYYNDVIGNDIYVKGVNRVNPKVHLAQDKVQINDTSLVFNYLSRLNSTTFFVEQTGLLTINVLGGPVLLGINTISVADTPLTMTDGVINYIYYKSLTNTVKTTTVEATATTDKGIIVAEITTVGGAISKIDYRQHKLFAGISIDTVILTNTVGLVDTYTITYSDGNTSTFDVTNGSSIATILKTGTTANIDTYTVTLTNGNTSTFTVTNGTSIDTILKTGTISNVDTYTITLTDGTTSTFTITNGFVALSEKIITQSATPTYNTDGARAIIITGLAQDITSMTSGLTGTPSSGDMFRMQIKDNGTVRNIFWGTAYENTGITLPLTTPVGIRMDLVFIYNSTTSKWRCVGASGVGSLPNYTITNTTTDRVLDTNATTIAELANVLGTLISDINSVGKGETGLTGPQGNTGPTGATGPQGVQGFSTLSGIVPPTTEGVNGDTYIDTVSGLTYTKSLGAWVLDGGDLTGPTGGVASVNTKTGIVTLTKTDVGLGNVDNTTDLAKPISTATQTALDGKEPTITKNTAFNKNFGTLAGEVSEGNHSHTELHTHTNKTILDQIANNPVETIIAGTNVSVTRTGNDVTIDSTASGGTGVTIFDGNVAGPLYVGDIFEILTPSAFTLSRFQIGTQTLPVGANITVTVKKNGTTVGTTTITTTNALTNGLYLGTLAITTAFVANDRVTISVATVGTIPGSNLSWSLS